MSVPRSDEKPSTNATCPPGEIRGAWSCHFGVCTRSNVRASRSIKREPGVVPRALRRLVGADGDRLAACPADLEDVDALGRDVLCLAARGVDEPQPPPELGGSEDLRIRRLGAGLLDLRRRLRAGAVGPEVGGEHEQARAVGRPVDVLDGARDLAELAGRRPRATARPWCPRSDAKARRDPSGENRGSVPASPGRSSPSTSPVQSRVSISFPCSRNVAETPNAMRDPSGESATSLGRSSSMTSSGVTSPAAMATASMRRDATGGLPTPLIPPFPGRERILGWRGLSSPRTTTGR